MVFFIFSIIFFYYNFGFPGRAGSGLIRKIQGVFLHWDVGHYEAIATFGYKQSIQYSFFPLLPGIVFLISKITTLSIQSSIVLVAFLNFALFYFSIKWFWQIYYNFKLDFILILSLPYSFFLLFPYTESLYLGLNFLFFSILYTKIKRWSVYLSILAFLLVFSRSFGIMLGPALLIYIFFENYSTIKTKQWKEILNKILLYFPIFVTYIIGIWSYLYIGYLGTGNWL